MSAEWLEEQIAGFDPALAIEDAWLPPKSWYTEPALYDVERDTVFRHNWLIAGRAEALANPGDYVALVIAGEPVVVVRGDDGELRAFYNVCRHHAAMVMIGEGNAEKMVCPYHGWTYALDGHLTRAPELGGVRGFDRECFGLAPLRAEAWGPFVFVHRGEKPAAAGAGLEVLRERLAAMDLAGLRFVRRVSYTIACNWKVYVDNYLDGGYHVAHLHKGLAAQLDLSSYRTEMFERYAVQSGSGAAAVAGTGNDFRERIGDEVLYAWLYPNFMINRYGPMMDTNWVIPRSHDETEVIFDYYFLESAMGDADFVERSLAASDVVQREDVDICESVQRGLGSSSYERGRYSVRREMAEHRFHRLLAGDMAKWSWEKGLRAHRRR